MYIDKKVLIGGAAVMLAVLLWMMFLRGPQTYEDCVIENLERAGQDAKFVIARKCKHMFPD